MTTRRFPPPWKVVELTTKLAGRNDVVAGYRVDDTSGIALAYVCCRTEPSL
jgi:hypothetical protein